MSFSANKSKTTTTPINPEWVTSGVQDQMQRIGGLAAADPYSFVAGPSALQTQAFDMAGGLGDYIPGAFEAASKAMQGAADYRPMMTAAQGVDPASAFSSLGSADPTAALARTLSGQVDNPYLASMNQANINQSLQGYNDALDAATNTLMRQALPAVRSGAMLAGQYGGSRQGIAEGLALSEFGGQAAKNARNLAQSAMDAGSQLYGGAYESAQNRMAQTATTLAGLSVDNARANADRDMQAQTSNAANGLAAAQLNLSGGQALGGLGQQGLDALGQLGGTQQALQAAYQRAPLDLLQATSNMYSSMPLNLFNGSTSTQKGKQLNISLDDIARAGAFITSDPRVKHNIFSVGADPGGRNLYGYNYDGEPDGTPPHIGYMADEIAVTDPEAVGIRPSGLKMINPSVLKAKNDAGAVVGAPAPPNRFDFNALRDHPVSRPSRMQIEPIGDFRPPPLPSEPAKPRRFDWDLLRHRPYGAGSPMGFGDAATSKSKPFSNWSLLRSR